MTINTGSSTGGAPAIPFNQSNTFALNQVLMFDTTLNAFVNTALPTGGTTGEINTVSNLGAGQGVFKDKLGADMRFKTIVAGTGIAVTADTDEVFIAATGAGTGDITGGTSTGSGNAVFRDKSGANLQFRSLTAGTNVTLTQNADDIVVNAGTNALTLNNIADTGYVKVANNLSEVTAATARTNLAISSTAEADAKYVHLNTDKAPTVDGAVTLGTGVKRFKEIYSIAFKGNADTATTATSMTGFTPGNYVAKAGGTMTGTLVLSGTPTSNLHAATKIYVDTVIADTISSAPGVLDTLNEIAAALGDDANFATTMTTALAGKLPLAGGTLTGALTLAGNPASALIAAPKQYVDAGDALQLTRASNLSDLANAATARTNLGLGTAAITASGAYLPAGTLTTGVAEGSNLYFTNARADARITAADTDDLSEGSTNLYHTIARAKAATILDAIVNGVTDVAPSQNAVFDALALKEGTLAAGTTTQYYRGDKSWQTLNTTAVAEGGNLYHTSARADARIAAANISDLSNVHTTAATDGQVLKWVNANSRWEPASHSTVIGANDVNDLHIDWGTGTNQVSTADIPEATNLYFTNARAQAVSINNLVEDTTPQLGGTLDANGKTIDMGVNIITDAKVGNYDTAVATMPNWNSAYGWANAGHTNWDTAYTHSQAAHYATSNHNTDFDTRLATKTTANLTENTNLYFTNARADARITAAVGTSVQAFDADLTAIAGLTNTDSNFIVGNGSAWVAENAATARTSLGLGTMATALTSVYYTKTETDARFANVVGTGANLADLADASAARTNLGLGTAAVANTTAFADPLLSNLTNNATARTNLGTIGVAEGDARYVRLDVNYLPTADNAITLGDTTKRFNTIHARQFKGQMAGSFDSSMNTDDLLEGSSNLYYTNVRVDARITNALIDEDNMATNSATRLPSQQSVKAYVDAQAHYSSFNADFDTRLATKTTANLTEGANLYYTNARADARITNAGSANWNTAYGWGNHASGGYLTSIAADSIKDTMVDWGTGANQVSTADVPEQTNLYYTDARADARVTAGFAAKSTTNLSEGTNLYYTDARVDTRVGTKSVDVLSDVDTTSAAPTADQVLTWNAGSSKWVPATAPGAGGTGEVNTGANVGTAGVGVFDGKVGATLNFRKLNSLDANLTIVDDSSNDKIDFDLNDDVMLTTENLAGVALPASARINIGLGSADSPTFGGVGTGSVTINATPTSGPPAAPTYSGIIFKSLPVASGSGHKWLFGNEQDGDHSFSYYTINDAGANVGSGTTYILTRPVGTKFISIAGTGIRTYINGLYYPEADGTTGQVLKTDGAGTLSWTTVSGGITTLTALTDVDAVVAGDNAKILYYNHATTSFKWKVDAGGIALTDLSVTTVAAGTAALAYNSGTGVFTYTPPNLSSYLTSETSHADVVQDGDFASQGIMLRGGSAGSYSILADASANWNTAFGWGNHASGGYLTSIAANSINDTHIDWGTGSNQVSTADIPEATNLYYTDVRADARITAALIDEDNMATNSATRLPSQQSVKAYVDAQTHETGIDDIVEDTTPQLGGDLDGNSKAITGVKRLEIVDSAHTGSSLDISNGAVSGGVQKTYVLSGSTSNNTQTEIFVGAQASTRMAVSSGNVWMFEVDIISIKSGGGSEQAGWKYSGMIHNVAGTTSLTSNLGEVEVDPQTNWSVAVEADNTNDALVIKVTGENSKTIKWAAFVKTTQLS